MNKVWIDRNLDFLSFELKDYKQHFNNAFFEPTDKIYDKLESGNEQDLQYVTNEISKYLGLKNIPSVKYDWGIKMEPEVAGQIRSVNHNNSIHIPFFYVGKKYEIGCILAHELTHAFLFSKNIIFSNIIENEMFTDLTSIFIGLGKLVLNGKVEKSEKHLNENYIFGYLALNLVVYSYKRLIKMNSVKRNVYLKNLKTEIQNLF